MKSIKPGKQRKRMFNAPLHKKRKWIAAHLSENLLLKYDHRSAQVVKGDTVKVKIIGFGENGKISLSKKALLPGASDNNDRRKNDSRQRDKPRNDRRRRKPSYDRR